MIYGSTREMWLVGYRNSECDGPPHLFATERAAIDYAKSIITTTKDVSIYRAQLAFTLVVDEPRLIDESSQTQKEQP